MTLSLFKSSPPLRVKVPLLVEVEAGAGFEGGLADLDRFVSRTIAGISPVGPPIELPFPIATEASGGKERRIVRNLPVLFLAHEIAIPKNDSDAVDD